MNYKSWKQALEIGKIFFIILWPYSEESGLLAVLKLEQSF